MVAHAACSELPTSAVMCSLQSPTVLHGKVRQVNACWNNLTAEWRKTVATDYVNATAATGSRQSAFEDIYDNKRWAPRGEPLSGLGSSVAWTTQARAAIKQVILRHRVKHIVDAPCGDLTWMRTLFPMFESMGVRYTGVDIVRSQIAKHRRSLAKPGVREFAVVDLAASPPPRGDLIFSRQALQHLNAHDALHVLHQWSAPGVSSLLLTTSYQRFKAPRPNMPGRHADWDGPHNFKLQAPGSHMTFMDLQKTPFDLPAPLETFVEQDRSSDKTTANPFKEILGLWQLPLEVKVRGTSCGGEHAPKRKQLERRSRAASAVPAAPRGSARGGGGGAATQAFSSSARPLPRGSSAQRMAELKQLLSAELITQDEYNAKRKAILDAL